MRIFPPFSESKESDGEELMAEQDVGRKEALETVVTQDTARRELTELMARTRFTGERFRITFHGDDAAALVPMKDLERLRALDAA